MTHSRVTALKASNGYGVLCACFAILLLLPTPLHGQSRNGTPLKYASPPRNWQFGAFFAGGIVPFYETHVPSYTYITPYGPEQSEAYKYTAELNLFNAGILAGRNLTAPKGHGILQGRLEALVEFMPFWLARYPAQRLRLQIPNYPQFDIYEPIGAINRFGISVTPFLLRWNFTGNVSRKNMPWMQLGGGLLWTNHKFPVQLTLPRTDTSVINFTPQVGIGDSIFLNPRKSLDFAVKAVHISNASLGDDDPGLNVTLQFSVGLSFWR